LESDRSLVPTIAEFGSAFYAVTAGFAPLSPDFVVRVIKRVIK
jgi:hypothetical protein